MAFYVTTDRWTSLREWQAFREKHGAEYDEAAIGAGPR